LSEIDAEYGDVLCHAEVRSLGLGMVLKLLFSFEEGTLVAVLSDKK
jgi:hypothetical protein